MISREDLLIVEDVREPISYRGKISYYGLNVSSDIDLEPIDQLDGFLVAKYIQQLFGQQEKFYAYVAGVYNTLNARSSKEALKTAEKRKQLEQEKKVLLQRVMSRLQINGSVLTTYDLWDDESYWEFVDRFFYDGNYDYMPDTQKIRETVRLREFPLEILGKMKGVATNVPTWIRSGALYLPAEVAESLWLRERYGVEWKIGPASEETFDQFIAAEGIGIIRTAQPKAIESGDVKDAMPYIGKSTQSQRILFSDTLLALSGKCFVGNPSFERAFDLAGIYEELSGERGSGSMERIWRLISLGK